MLTNISLENFKCFERVDLPMTNLNLFSGINSMGKSTIIQAFLLLRQSYEQNKLTSGIYLNGSYVKVGTGKDLLYVNAGKNDKVGICLTHENLKPLKFCMDYDGSADFLKFSDSVTIRKNLFGKMNLLKSGFEYISAERLGPRNLYEKSYSQINEKQQIGIFGEFSAHYILIKGEEQLENEKVCYSDEPANTLIIQLQRWLSEVSPGIKLNIEDYINADAVGLTYRISEYQTFNNYKAVNIGFGITYVLPVILSLLKARKDDFIIIENPEAHLHPKGQRKLGELIAKASAGGVQVVLETHSDHVLNGIRLSVKNKVIDKKLVRLNYFQKKNDVHQVENPEIFEDGRLTFWPEGFFDEWDKAIDEMF